MPTLIKIAAAPSSIYGHPYKWVRTLSPSSSSTSYSSSSSSLFPFHSSFPLSSQTACNNLPHSSKSFQGGKLSHRPWRTTMTSCAPPAHVSTNHSPSISYNNSNNISSPTTKNSLLGFPGQKFSTSTANKRNSSNVKSKLSSSELGGEERDKISSSSSRTVLSSSSSDMGSENKDHEWFSRNNNSTIHNDCNGPVGQHRPHQLPSHDYQKHSKLLTLPTVLTLGRVAAVPLLVSTFYVDSWWGITATTSIFIAAAITDWLDGYLARKMKSSSAFGAFLDPVADKLMVAATLVLLCTQPLKAFGQVPWILTIPAIAIIGREITMSAVREWAASQSSKLLEAVAVNNLGKWKTATQMTALTILLATRDSSLAGPGILVTLGVVLLYISAWLAVWSLFVYMRKIWKVLWK